MRPTKKRKNKREEGWRVGVKKLRTKHNTNSGKQHREGAATMSQAPCLEQNERPTVSKAKHGWLDKTRRCRRIERATCGSERLHHTGPGFFCWSRVATSSKRPASGGASSHS